MAKRKHRKNAGQADRPPKAAHGGSLPKAEPHAEIQPAAIDAASVTPPEQAGPAARLEPVALPSPLPNATTLLDEVQQRCEKLRQWQRDAQESLRARAVEVERRERAVDEIQRQVEVGRTRLELDQDAMKRARLMLDKERAQTEQSQQAVEAERSRLERVRAELHDQREEFENMRCEMDAEWASLARVRRAQESLAAALDADRTRVQELRLNDSLARVGQEVSDQDTDDAPGLSLTQAA